MAISAQEVKKLRDITGVSIMACKKALTEANGDIDEAQRILRKQGQKVAEKKLTRETNQGLVVSYIHNNNRLGSLVEVHCETDFVAKNSDFQKLCKEIAIQVTGYNPLYISADYIPKEDLEKKEKLFREDYSSQGLEGERLEKAVKSHLEKFKEENSLLSQPYFRDTKRTVEDLIQETIAKVGENIQVKRFVRYQI